MDIHIHLGRPAQLALRAGPFAALLFLLVGLAAAAPNAVDAIPDVITYQGYATDANGVALSGSYDVCFRLYDLPSGGTPLWEECRTGENQAPFDNGLFNVLLGQAVPLPDPFPADPLYMGVTVEADGEMAPRERLGSVPFALRASRADSATSADLAQAVPDGSITSAKLHIDGAIDMGGSSLENIDWVAAGENHIALAAGTTPYIRAISQNGMYLFLDANNDSTTQEFKVWRDSDHNASPVAAVWTLREDGRVSMTGPLDMGGNPIVDQGALIEANLQTPGEQAAERIERFSEGDVLCWEDGQLELCAERGTRMVQAVADADGKPIVLGAEQVKVFGPVREGDFLVASAVPGVAAVDNTPAPGTVIAQALEPFAFGRGTIKAMIRKF